MIYFITGSLNKLNEVKAIIPEIEQLDVDLPEIQEVDPKKVIEAKLMEAKNHHKGQFIVEDTGLYLECLGGLPGPLIKWFMKTLGYEGIYKIAEKFGENRATARTVIGFWDGSRIEYFEGTAQGKLVEPRGESNFGWEPIFVPEGYDQTYAEMGFEKKNAISMRRLAVEKLKDYLEGR